MLLKVLVNKAYSYVSVDRITIFGMFGEFLKNWSASAWEG